MCLLNVYYKLAGKGHCKVSAGVNENMLLSWIIAWRYWSDELVVWQPIGWQELLLITKELLDLYISRNRVVSEPCAMKSFEFICRFQLLLLLLLRVAYDAIHSRITNKHSMRTYMTFRVPNIPSHLTTHTFFSITGTLLKFSYF